MLARSVGPPTLQATIARIDRLDPAAKRTLSGAAVIASKFSRDVLEALGIDPALESLVTGEFIDQIALTGNLTYAFHHPLIRRGTEQLLRNRDEWDLLQRGPWLLPSAVEEMLCWTAPVRNMRRILTADIEFHGTALRDGER
jgi:hypothetical protein